MLPWGSRYALVVVLSHSRLLWLRFYRTQSMAVLTGGLQSAFERFGGVPDELLFDQMRAVVLSDDRAAGGELILNTEFLRFAAHWGFRARSCRPYRARTKGKVERPIRYLRESFFYGRRFANDADLARDRRARQMRPGSRELDRGEDAKAVRCDHRHPSSATWAAELEQDCSRWARTVGCVARPTVNVCSLPRASTLAARV